MLGCEMVTEDDNSDILNLEFVAKCEGRYSVSVNMYGVGVKGSPMEVEIRGSNAIIEKIVVVEVETENLKDINTLEGEAVVGDEEIIRQNSLDHETEVVNVPGEAFVEDVSVIEEGNMDYNLDEETIANNNVDSVEELIAEDVVLKEVESKVIEEKLDEFPPRSLPAIYSVGSSCLVRWCEDSVWYRARVDRIDEGLYEVTFLDYGNKVVVGLDNMVATVAVYITRCVLACLVEVLTTRLSRIIPPPLLAKTLSPLQECCARWRDGNWYRARFIKYLDKEHQRCFVVLVDYGNIYQVGVENIRCQIYGQRIPIQCLTAVLTGVEPVGGAWSQECLDHIQHRTRWVRWWTASLKM